jgi:hypothetical protein
MFSKFEAQPMELDEARDILSSLSFDELKERCLWVRASFDNSIMAEDYIAGLANKLYEKGFYLYHGVLVTQNFSETVVNEEAYLWARMGNLNYGVSSSHIMVERENSLVSKNDVPSLINQAVSIIEAFESGYGVRSKEVQRSLGGLLGVDLSELAE